MSSCSLNGLCLEYAFKLVLTSSKLEITGFNNHKNKWVILSKEKKLDYLVCAWHTLAFFNILDNARIEKIGIERLADSNGCNGIVDDIHLKTSMFRKVKLYRLSVKNQKLYTKSQRPGTTPLHCGYSGRDSENCLFKDKYRVITTGFYNNYREYKRFSEIKEKAGNDIIKEKLYEPVYSLVENFLDSCNKERIKDLFIFLKGKCGYWQIVNKKKNIIIYDFRKKYSIPTRVKIFRDKRRYIILEFNNNHKFSLRLHTAKNEMRKNPDLKFDTVLFNQDELYQKYEITKDCSNILLI